MRSTFLNRADPWFLFLPPTLPSADPWDESQTKLLMFLKKHLCFLISGCSITQAPDLPWVPHHLPADALLIPQEPALWPPLWMLPKTTHNVFIIHSYITILKFSISFSLLCHVLPTMFFLVFIIPRNLLQKDIHNRLSWNVDEWVNVSLSTLWIQMTFKNYFRTFWWDLEAQRLGIIIIEGT